MLALAAAVSGRADSVRLAGSDLAASALTKALQEGGDAPGADWSIDLAGSKPGLDALEAGRADIAVVLLESIPAGGGDLSYTPVAYRAPAIVVSARNPVAQFTLPALAAVIGEGETENHRRWSELGLPGEWSARSISIHVATADDPLLLDYLRLRVLKSPRLKSSLATGAATVAILARLREDESAMGILAAPPAVMTGLRVIPVAAGSGGIAFGPTPENVHAGDYPMRMILAVATRSGIDPTGASARRILLSDRVAQALAAHGFVPVPAGVRARLADVAPQP